MKNDHNELGAGENVGGHRRVARSQPVGGVAVRRLSGRRDARGVLRAHVGDPSLVHAMGAVV